MEHERCGLFRLQVRVLAGNTECESAHYEDSLGEMEELGDAGRVDRAEVADTVCAQTAGFSSHNGAHHSQGGVDDTDGHAVHSVGEGRHLQIFLCRKKGYLVIVGAEYQQTVAGFKLFLVGELIQSLLQGLIIDVDYRELLAVVAGGRIGHGAVDKIHCLRRDRLALIAADTGAVKQSVFYVKHDMHV